MAHILFMAWQYESKVYHTIGSVPMVYTIFTIDLGRLVISMERLPSDHHNQTVVKQQGTRSTESWINWSNSFEIIN